MDAKDYEEMRRRVLERKKKDEEERLNVPQIEAQEPQVHVHPDAMAPDAATLLYVIAMAVATIFKGRILIWIILTIIWRRHMAKFGK